MADRTDGFAMGIVFLLNSLPREQAEAALRAATATYFLGASESRDEGVLRLTQFAGVLHQTGLKNANGEEIESMEGAREQLRAFRNG